jgi:hypothetical protein
VHDLEFCLVHHEQVLPKCRELKYGLRQPAFWRYPCCRFIHRLALQRKSLCPPWQGVSRKRWNKVGSFARLALCFGFVYNANGPDLVRWVIVALLIVSLVMTLLFLISLLIPLNTNMHFPF